MEQGTEKKANSPNSLSEFGENVILIDIWARGILKSMDCVKRKLNYETRVKWNHRNNF